MPQQTTEISIGMGRTSTSSNANCIDSFHDNDEDSANVDVVPKSKISLMCTLPQRYASSISRRPATHLTVALLLSITLSIIVFTKGNLHFDAPSIGWFSKGTMIANRAAQEQLVRDIIFREEEKNPEDGDEDEELYCSGEWYESEKLLDTNELNLVSFWKVPDLGEKSALDGDALYEMCLKEEYTLNLLAANDLCHKCSIGEEERCIQPFSLVGFARLFLLLQWNLGDQFELGTKHLLPSISCGELRDEWSKMVQHRFEEVMLECTNYLLEKNQFKPASNEDYSKCKNFPIMTASLVDAQFIETGRVKYTTSIFATKNDPASIKSMYYGDKANQFRSPPSLNLNERSSFEDELYEVGMNSLYLTPKQGFYELYMNERLPLDVAIGAVSLAIAAICVLIHTSSPFLTLIGLVQILFTLPVGYFVYYFICRVIFFPFLNVNSIFILFAVGVDDIFVVIDTWRTFRLELPPHSTTEQVAVYALPKIAFNTFVTSVTTAAAFFASAGIKIPVVASFVIFSGLLVTMDYVLSILIIFPALCMYDNWLTHGCRSRWLRLSVSKDSHAAVASIESNPTIETSVDEEQQQERNDCRESKSEVDMKDLEVFDDEHNAIEVATKSQFSFSQPPRPIFFSSPKDTSSDQAQAPSLQKDEAKGLEINDKFTIILHSIYKVVHLLRYPLLLMSFAAVIVSSIVASQIKSTDQLSEPILPTTNRYERHRQWSSKLLAYNLSGVREVLLIWGSTPTDTSRRIDPNQSSNLVFDESFDPSTESAQVFLLEQCEDVYYNTNNHTFFRQYTREDEVTREDEDSGCNLQRFNIWLKRESQSSNPTKTYIDNCSGESGIPVSPEIFHSCFIAYSKSYRLSGVFHDEGIVKLFAFTARTQTSFISPVEEQDKELKGIEGWREEVRKAAPDETRNFFFSSFGFHVTDSLKNMVSSARGAIGIATACASLMILLTTRSVMLTVLSAISVGYVFVSTTACLVGLGWTLGVFESILLAISVGIGSDYVLHVSHSYSMAPDNCFTREERTRYAVVHIGRPIIGSAVTTISTALMMMFAENQFSRKFATLLIVTIVQALIGSFVVFVALCDCFGPSAKSNKCGGARLQMCRRQNQLQQQHLQQSST